MTPPVEVLEHLGLSHEGWSPLSGGMNAVWRRGEHVLKQVTDPSEAQAERRLLATVQLPVNTPTLIGVADHQGATWLLTSWLPGERLSQVWGALERQERTAVAEALGHALAALWATPVDGLDKAPLGLADRPREVEAAVLRQLQFGLDPTHLHALRALAGSQPLEGDVVVTHADLHADQVLLGRGPRGWQVTGLLDFGDAVLAPRHYDLVSPFCDLLGPDRHLREALIDAAGLAVDADWDRRMLALTLLHPWMDLQRLLRPGVHLAALSAWLSARPPPRRGPA